MRWRGFVQRWGWRAYALPLLTVVTIAALATSTNGASISATGHRDPASNRPSSSVPPTAPRSLQLRDDPVGPRSNPEVLKAAQLPAGPAYTARGTGTFAVVAGAGAGVGSGPVQRYAIEVENGIAGVNADAFATKVQTTLADPRSWIAAKDVTLHRVAAVGKADWTVALTTPMTVRALCGYEIHVETSCWDSAHHRVVLNLARWVRGATAYLGDVDTYRLYAINHEVGHALGHQHSHECLPGGQAPVMMQQTLGLRSVRGEYCQANPWPYPPGVRGTPGHEEPDTPHNNEYVLGNE